MKLQLVVRRAPAAAGLRWLQQAWALFKQQPGLWIQLVLIIHLSSLLGALHPLLGVLVALLNPFLTAGLYRCIVASQKGATVSLAQFWQPLKEPACRAVFLRLAAANMLFSIPLTLLAQELYQQVQTGSVNFLLLLVFVVGMTLVLMLFAYAIAIAYFLKETRLLPIFQASFMACWRNVQPLSLYGAVAILLISTGIPSLFISWIVVLPLLSISFFLSFTEFFALTPVDTDSNGGGGGDKDDDKAGFLEV
jgi:uncharacterized membrane protein